MRDVPASPVAVSLVFVGMLASRALRLSSAVSGSRRSSCPDLAGGPRTGFKLLPLKQLRPLWQEHRGETVILAVTAVAIMAVSMFEGVLIGLVLAIAKTAWETSHIHMETTDTRHEPILTPMASIRFGSFPPDEAPPPRNTLRTRGGPRLPARARREPGGPRRR